MISFIMIHSARKQPVNFMLRHKTSLKQQASKRFNCFQNKEMENDIHAVSLG